MFDDLLNPMFVLIIFVVLVLILCRCNDGIF